MIKHIVLIAEEDRRLLLNDVTYTEDGFFKTGWVVNGGYRLELRKLEWLSKNGARIVTRTAASNYKLIRCPVDWKITYSNYMEIFEKAAALIKAGDFEYFEVYNKWPN